MGDNMVQWDNGILTMRQNQIDIQNSCIATLYQMYRTNPAGVKNFMGRIWDEWAQTSTRRLLVRAINNQWTKFGVYVYDPGSLSDDGFVNASYYGKSYVGNVKMSKGTLYGNWIQQDSSLFASMEGVTERIPNAYVGVVSDNWFTFLKDIGVIQSSSDKLLLQKLDEIKASANTSQSINSTIREESNKINSTLNEQKQIQQQQQQLQQEQNDFLMSTAQDSDVDISHFQTADINDPSASYMSNIFNTIYNAITKWQSKDIVLPIPNTNKSITIQADSTANSLKAVHAEWIITFVSAIYYFIVARFILYTVNKIVDKVKSGKILESQNTSNITTDLL